MGRRPAALFGIPNIVNHLEDHIAQTPERNTPQTYHGDTGGI